MSDLNDVDLTTITPDEFAQLVVDNDDQEVVAAIRAVGTEAALTRIFEGFEERFRADRASGVEALIQFVVKDEDEHPYRVRIANGACSAERGEFEEDPRVTLRVKLVPFLHLITGQAQGPRLFMTGKLKVKGDVMFASRIMNYFDTPSA